MGQLQLLQHPWQDHSSVIQGTSFYHESDSFRNTTTVCLLRDTPVNSTMASFWIMFKDGINFKNICYSDCSCDIAKIFYSIVQYVILLFSMITLHAHSTNASHLCEQYFTSVFPNPVPGGTPQLNIFELNTPDSTLQLVCRDSKPRNIWVR